MKQRKINISAILLLFVFLLGTIGVNVSKVYCHLCQETYARVVFTPTDTPCLCAHDCACCDDSCQDMHEKNCNDAEPQHAYYKVHSDCAISHVEVQFGDMILTANVPSFVVTRVEPILTLFNPCLAYAGNSPPLAFLCTFRC